MVVGGAAFQNQRHKDLCAALQGIKDVAAIRSEMKWSKYKGGQRTPADRAPIDLLFSRATLGQPHFHCLIAEFGEFSHKGFEGGRPEISANRMYSPLLIHRGCRFYACKCDIYVYPDKRDGSADLERLWWLNYKASFDYSVPQSIRRIEKADLASCNLMQVVDVVIGDIAYASRSTPTSWPSRPEGRLAQYILAKSCHPSWDMDTHRNARRFTVWNFKHQTWVADDIVLQGLEDIFVRASAASGFAP